MVNNKKSKKGLLHFFFYIFGVIIKWSRTRKVESGPFTILFPFSFFIITVMTLKISVPEAAATPDTIQFKLVLEDVIRFIVMFLKKKY